MYKRARHTSLPKMVEKAACSAALRENVVNRTIEATVNASDIDLFDEPCDSDPGEKSALMELLTSCGMNINNGPYNELRKDQAVFVRDLNAKLNAETSTITIEQFITSLKNYCSDESNFSKALSSSVTANDCDVARGTTQESLIRLLLQISNLQTKLSEYLLDKLAELSLKQDESKIPLVTFFMAAHRERALKIRQISDYSLHFLKSTHVNEEIKSECVTRGNAEISAITWTKMILQPFRFLDCIVDPKMLCEHLFDIIYSNSDKTIQQEIIVCLPDVIGDIEHHFAANELSKLLQSDPELMPSILDALTNLSIQSEIRCEVRDSLINTLKNLPVEYLPNIVKFLLATCDSESYNEVIDGLRRELFSTSTNRSLTQSQNVTSRLYLPTSEVETIQVLLTFSHIRNGLLASKQLANAWIKNMSSVSSYLYHRPLDIIVLLILNDVTNDNARKRLIEKLIGNRIKNGFFRNKLIVNTFTSFAIVIKEYFRSLMSILSKLFKSPEETVTNFVIAFYMSCFEYGDEEQCKIIVMELLTYIGAGDAKTAQMALNILSEITNMHVDKIRPMAYMFDVLLNKLIDLPLQEVQLLIDTLSYVAYSNSDCDDNCDTSSLKRSIEVFVEKQMTSSNIKQLGVGILGALSIIKHTTLHSNDETNVWPDKQSDEFDETQLSERAQKVLPMLKLIIDGTKTTPEAQGLCFDQFSLMLMKCKNLDRSLIFYTAIVMKENLKKYFLICNDEIKKIDFLECSLNFGLANEDEFVALNLTPVIIDEIKSNPNAGLRIYSFVLPSLLRLIRGLEYENLGEIDGLLETAVLFPDRKLFDDFVTLSADERTVIMDSLFVLVNWFRELVNCFACLMKQSHGKQVLIRLKTIVFLQKMIAKYLPQMRVADYCPPKCNFHKPIRRPSLPSDKKKKKTGIDSKKRKKTDGPDIRKHLMKSQSTSQLALIDEDDDESKDTGDASSILKHYKQFFRELDLDVWIMLSLPLNLNPEPEKNWGFSPEFGPSELLFILEDLVEKLNYVLITSCKRQTFFKRANDDVGLVCSSLYTGAPDTIVKNVTKLIPRLCAHLETVSKFCENLLTSNDDIYDNPGMFIPEAREIKECFALLLKSFGILFSWSGFANAKNEDLFIVALAKIVVRTNSQRSENSVDCLVKETVQYFANFEKSVLHLECASNLVSVIDALSKYSSQKEIKKILSGVCWNFLSHRWFNWNGAEEKGVVLNSNVEFLLTSFLSCSGSKLSVVCTIADSLSNEVASLNVRNATLTTLPNINKSNLYVLIKVVLKVLALGIKEALEKDNDCKEKLNIWLKVVNIMESMVKTLREQPLKHNLTNFVKGSVNILKLFLTQGIKVCSEMFRSESSLVTQILKTLQTSTRYIQKIFDNSKVTEDSSLNLYIPNMRSLLESILLKVKNIMILNGCTQAFFVGSMRNKDLQGQDILSQSTVNDEPSESMVISIDNSVSAEVCLETDDDISRILADEDKSSSYDRSNDEVIELEDDSGNSRNELF